MKEKTLRRGCEIPINIFDLIEKSMIKSLVINNNNMQKNHIDIIQFLL